jgi:hypothetical protein
LSTALDFFKDITSFLVVIDSQLIYTNKD